MPRHYGMPGAIVLSSDFKVLGVVRCLGRRSIPNVVIENQPRSAWFSRYVMKRFKWKSSMDGSTFLNFLLSIGKGHRLERWMLFSYIQYRDVLGDAPIPVIPCYGYLWVRLLTDIPAGIQEIRAGITTRRAYLRSLAGNIVFSVFDWRDPLPVVGDLVIALSRLLRGFQGKGSGS